MKKETAQPLWKVLNEQRTNGEWKLSKHEDNNDIVVRAVGSEVDNDIVANCSVDAWTIDINKEQQAANAQYTALAVNNLHLLAEALQALTSWTIENTSQIPPALVKAKEALNRIS